MPMGVKDKVLIGWRRDPSGSAKALLLLLQL